MVKILFQNTKTKIVIAFSILLFVMGGIQYFSSVSINGLIDNEKGYHKNVMALSNVESVKASVLAIQGHLKNFYVTLDKNTLIDTKEHIKNLLEDSRELKDNLSGSAQIDIVNRLDNSVKQLIIFEQNLSQLPAQSNSSAIKNIFEDYNLERKVADIEVLCDNIDSNQDRLIVPKQAANEIFANKVSQMDLVGTLFTFFVIIFFGWVLINDIDRRNALENDLKLEKNKAEQSVLIKEQFMANMSHEIRTPMTSIIGFTNLLERTNLDEKQRDYVRTVKGSSVNLLTIVNDILDFSKIEAGMVRFEETSFSIHGLFHSVNTMFLPKAKEKNNRLIFHPIENIPETLIGDPARLTQILVNLIGNSLKFTSEGEIEVSAKLLKEEKKNVVVQFKVFDTGIGIPKDKIGIIFDRFQQADADTSRRFGGTGLGLSIVKSLIEFQGGTISVESEEGKGSLFSFTIPYKKSTHEKKKQILSEERIIQKSNLVKVCILVAEDNPMNRKLIGALFNEWKINFEFAENGKEAIEKLSSGHFEMVLMDIQMPEINGYEATKIIREQLKLKTPIIAMTAHALSGEYEKCIASGMNDYISKPLKEDELYKLIVKYAGDFSKNEKTEFIPSANDEEKVTNLEFLTSLANGKKEFFDEMIQIFLEECPIELSRLQKSIEEKNFQLIHANAHAMKSTIPFVGLDAKLKPLLEVMEESSDLNKINQLFPVVELVCNKAIKELKNLN